MFSRSMYEDTKEYAVIKLKLILLSNIFKNKINSKPPVMHFFFFRYGKYFE